MVGEAISGFLMVAKFVEAHPELFSMLLDALEGKKLTSDQVTAALRAAMVEASDFEMRREMGG